MSGVLPRLLALQGAITLLCAATLLAWRGAEAALAGLAGGAAACAGAMAYGIAYRLLNGRTATAPLRVFLVCEVLRMATAVGLLMAGLAAFAGPDALAFLGAFTAALMAYLLVWVL